MASFSVAQSELSPNAIAPARGAGEGLPLSVLIGYGLPQIPLGFMAALAGMYLLKFASDVLLIAPAVFSVLFAFSRICDAISDPVVGYWSDRTRHAAGRRRPWILAETTAWRRATT